MIELGSFGRVLKKSRHALPQRTHPLLDYIGDSEKKRKLKSMGTSLKRKKSKTVKKSTVVVSKKVKNYGNDPFFIKKAKQIETILKKHGLPNSISHV